MVSIRKLLSLLVLLLLSSLAFAATWTTIDYPGASDTYATGINNNGDIVGVYVLGGLSHGFVLKAGTFTSIDVPGAIQTYAKGINDSGMIVGYYSTQYRDGIGFLFGGQNFTDVDFPGYQVTIAYAIDNAGDVVGYYGNGGSNPDYHGFKWTNGAFRTLEVDPAATILTGINNHGYMVGYDPWSFDTFVRKPGGTIQTIPFSGPCCGIISGLNDSQALVGYYPDPSLNGFRLNGVTLNLVKLKFPGATYTYATGINNFGVAVGSYTIGNSHHGFVETK